MFNRKKEYRMLNKMLDDAVSGEFEATIYDERELSKLQAKLERYLRGQAVSEKKILSEKDALKELLTNISHQTKTPLTNILLYAQLIEENADSAELKMYADEVMVYVKKLEILINVLVKMSRLEVGVFQFEPAKTSLQDIIDACVDMAKAKASEKNISIRIGDEENIEVVIDKKWTTEAIYNILDNAIKYSEAGSVVSLGIFKYEMFSRIRIKDEGIGIAEDEIPRIFGRFYRGKNVHDKEGIGVGLYLAREIIESQGGYIKVVSGKGNGTAFEIYLPMLQH